MTQTQWIFSQPGLTGTVADRWNQFLTSAAIAPGTFSDRMYAYYASLGHTGTMADRKKAWEQANLT